MIRQCGNFTLLFMEIVHPCGIASDCSAIFGISLGHGFEIVACAMRTTDTFMRNPIVRKALYKNMTSEGMIE